MMGGILLILSGAWVVRHAWRWALSSDLRRIVVQGCQPTDLVLTARQADLVARLACWAWARPVVVATLHGTRPRCECQVYRPGCEPEHRTLRPRNP